MGKITLKTANRKTSVPRSTVRKAVKEVYAQITGQQPAPIAAPVHEVIVTNRVPIAASKK